MPDKEGTEINIVTACDNAYVQNTAVFIKSLFAKNHDFRFKIFILVPNNFIYHRSLERNLGPNWTNVEFLTIDVSDVNSLKVVNQAAATYFRLFIGRLIPADIDRIIYLDSDILIAGALGELWATDLEKYAVAATIDAGLDEDISLHQRIGLDSTSRYFNAGVLLIDLCRWRYEKLGERALAYAIEYPERITWEDQCAINHVLNGQFKELTKDWNFQTAHLRWADHEKCTLDSLRELDAAKVIHFTGHLKPWSHLANHPMKWLYWEYLRQTEWHDYCPPDGPGRNALK